MLTRWARKELPEPAFYVAKWVVLESLKCRPPEDFELADHADATWWEFNYNRREVKLKGAFGVAEIDALEARVREVWPKQLAKVADPDDYIFHGQLEIYELDYGENEPSGEPIPPDRRDERGCFMPYVLACYSVRCFRRVPNYDFAARALAPPGDRGWCRLSIEEHRVATLDEATGFLARKIESIGMDVSREWSGMHPYDLIGMMVNRLNSPIDAAQHTKTIRR